MNKNGRLLMLSGVWDEAALDLAIGDKITTLPIEHTQLKNKSRIFATTSKVVQIKAHWNELQPISSLVMFNHNLTPTAQVRLRFYADTTCNELLLDTGNFGALVEQTIADWDWRQTPVVSTASYKTQFSAKHGLDNNFARGLLIDISDPDNTAPELRINRIYAGIPYRPIYNKNYGSQMGFNMTMGAMVRKASFSLEVLDTSDALALTKFVSATAQAKNKDFLIALYPNIGGELEVFTTYQCMFSTIPVISDIRHDWFKSTIEVEEI